ncbi:hypothetical protein BpHYR1_010737 [Brachionus plicatilis]|uniref:Uncharacterized protein n=1 Tax=Brachionus plicatilis TaxID=10195 RepID=A0A3M7SZ23_BRAPC|nr:hypothetical protein BpHYR1_010737 [Brachionus plicatilis]
MLNKKIILVQHLYLYLVRYLILDLNITLKNSSKTKNKRRKKQNVILAKFLSNLEETLSSQKKEPDKQNPVLIILTSETQHLYEQTIKLIKQKALCFEKFITSHEN